MRKNNYQYKKSTKIDWIDEIPSHWQEVRLGSLFNERKTKVSDKDFPPLSVTKNGIVPQLDNAAKSNDGDNRKLVLKGDFAINSRSDRKGSSGLSRYDGSVSLINIVLKPIDIEPTYSEYLLKSYCFKEEYYRFGRGIVEDLWTTRYTEMKNMVIPCPSPDEQIKIAAFLDYKLAKINRFIKKKKQLIKLLNEQKAAIINQAVTKGLDPNVKMKPSGVEWLGDIPEHWELRKLKEYCKGFGRIGFRGYKSTDLVDKGEGAITISPSNIKEDNMVFNHCSYLSWLKYEESPEIKVFNDDILMVKTGSSFGKVGIVKNLGEKATINPQLLVLKELKTNPDFLFFILKSKLVHTQLKMNVIGSTIPTISQSKILNFKIVMPPQEDINLLLSQLNEELQLFNRTIDTIEKEIKLTQEYKTAIIAETVTGKIDVREYHIPEVLNEEESFEDIEEEINLAAKEEAEYETQEE